MKDLQWKQQFCETIEALEQNNTRELVKRPRGAKRPHTKCILKLNETTHGSKRYKARSVVRGDQQEYGVSYALTFSAVLELTSGKVTLVMSRI
ncbi:Reverse transcriptase (RNA-dependent DNA polymerase) [Phytophthora infestans]|uniref:Reverse transcriptase (RNA-dependent DNA polymerase) n=2 Tax=Phytophthora infestans TaxID=4787 RepID=A0A8S9TMJ8_PHYIN|nr:Reverse transcriptase (RNA-dependent DNA polymerase) [Phytophthora infestans]